MKKIIFLSLSSLLFVSANAQRCLDLSIVTLMKNIQIPSSAAQNFKDCKLEKDEHNQTVIVNYGENMVFLDTLINQKLRDFTYATANAEIATTQMPSQQSIQSAQALAAQLQKMTPDQQKQWAMQQASKPNHSAASAAVTQEDPTTVRLEMTTFDIATRQLQVINDEFSAKFRKIIFAKSAVIDSVKQPNTRTCPAIDKYGTVSCTCVDGIEGKYWQKIVSIQDNYNQQLINLLQSYIPRIKALESSIDDNIIKLKYGDDLKTAQFKKQLLSAQSSGFAGAFMVTMVCIKEIRKGGSDAYVNKVNCDNLVYDLSCGK